MLHQTRTLHRRDFPHGKTIEDILSIRSQRQLTESETAELCGHFAGLVKRHAYHSQFECLGEDAEAEAWLAFLKAVKEYESSRGIHFIGFVVLRIRYALWSLIHKRKAGPIPLEANTKHSTTTSAEAEALTNIRTQEIIKTINVLPIRQREVILLTTIKELSIAEAASFLGISHTAAKNARWHGFKQLRQRLA